MANKKIELNTRMIITESDFQLTTLKKKEPKPKKQKVVAPGFDNHKPNRNDYDI